MPHIQLNNENLPGITGLFDFRPQTAEPLRLLAETLLRGKSSLSSADREIIASYVSWKNNCFFCHTSHGAAAAAHLELDIDFIDEIKNGFPDFIISDKLHSLLQIATEVTKGGKFVTKLSVKRAKEFGASDEEIHDTILIAAAFCMYNRYVDGLATDCPEDASLYSEMGKRLARQGYVLPK